MSYSEEAKDLAFAWEMTRTPLEAIAEDFIKLGNLLREHIKKEKNELP
jgi:hypothetical protein